MNKESSPNFGSNINSLNARVAIMICSANQLTGFYMMVTMTFNKLSESEQIKLTFIPPEIIREPCFLIISGGGEVD